MASRSAGSIERMPSWKTFLRRHQRPVGRQDAVEARLAAEEGDRHAVHVAGRRGRRRVEIGMRVEPQHEQRPPGLGGMARDARDAAHRQAVVAAEEDREGAALHRAVGRLRRWPASSRRSRPHCAPRPSSRIDGSATGSTSPRSTTSIAERSEGRLDVGDPQRFRTHDAAAAAGAGVDRCADQVDILDLLVPCSSPIAFDRRHYRADGVFADR